MFAHLNPHSSSFGDICALYSPFLHQLTMQSSLLEPGHLRPCAGYSRRRDQINLGLLRSLYQGGGGHTVKLFAFTAQHAHPLLPLLTHAPTPQRIAAYHHQHQTPLYQYVTAYTPQSHTVAPPTHLLRFLCIVLQAVNIWTDVSAPAGEPYRTPSQPWS